MSSAKAAHPSHHIMHEFSHHLQIVSLPYRTVGNASLATSVTWAVIAGASLPIWFTHHLVHDPGNEKREWRSIRKIFEIPDLSQFPSSIQDG